MTEKYQGARTRPSNRLSHGLASRAAAEARVEEATELAGHLIGTAPRTPEVWSAALALADAVLHEHAAQAAKLSLLKTSGPPNEGAGTRANPEGPQQISPRRDSTALDQAEGIIAFLTFLEENARLARNFDEYQRKALSRRSKLIIRLDYMMHEALRAG